MKVDIPFQFSFEKDALRVADSLPDEWANVPGEQPIKGDWLVAAAVSTTGPEPFTKDRISPEAIKQGVNQLLQMRTVLFNHDPMRTIGRILKARDHNGRLETLIRISKTEPEIWEKITEGVLSKWSIRGKVQEMEPDPSGTSGSTGRPEGLIRSWLLKEASLVSVPAQPKAETAGWWVQKDWRDVMGKESNDVVKDTGQNTLEDSISSEENESQVPEVVEEVDEFLVENEVTKEGPQPTGNVAVSVDNLLRLKRNLETVLAAAESNKEQDVKVRKNLIKNCLELLELILGGVYPYPYPYPYP